MSLPHAASQVLNPMPAARWARAMGGFVLMALLTVQGAALAVAVDLSRARQLIGEGRYQDAYELLLPFEPQARNDAAFNLLLGEAALRTQRAEQAKALFERSLAGQPDLVEAHLGLGRAYLALGDYARAKIEFETVFRFDGLPADLQEQAEIYARAALAYAGGRRALTSGYAIFGYGNYRTGARGGIPEPENDRFFAARVGGNLNYLLSDGYALDGSLDYRFRDYDNDDRRNDSDLRWNGAVSRDDGRGQSGRGPAWPRQLSRQQRLPQRLRPVRQLPHAPRPGQPGGGRRRDPPAPLPHRPAARAHPQHRRSHRQLDAFTAGRQGELHARRAGRARVQHPAQRRRRQLLRAVALAELQHHRQARAVSSLRGGRTTATTSSGWALNGDRLVGIGTRNDNLYEVGGGLTWQFLPNWSLNPEILYIRDQSNILAVNYSSTEIWITLRWDF